MIIMPPLLPLRLMRIIPRAHRSLKLLLPPFVRPFIAIIRAAALTPLLLLLPLISIIPLLLLRPIIMNLLAILLEVAAAAFHILLLSVILLCTASTSIRLVSVRVLVILHLLLLLPSFPIGVSLSISYLINFVLRFFFLLFLELFSDLLVFEFVFIISFHVFRLFNLKLLFQVFDFFG